MFKKGLLAAGLMVAAVASAPQPASAGTSVNVGIGIGGGWGGYRCGWFNNWCGHPYGWQPVYAGPPPATRLTCREGARVVWNHGFNNVMPVSCTWSAFIYDATRQGHHWRVRVNPWNGRVFW
jgi:hypothetical protein